MRLEYVEKQLTEQNIVLRRTILPLLEQTTNLVVTVNHSERKLAMEHSW